MISVVEHIGTATKERTSEPAHDVLWRRLRYMLSPQWDVYMSLPPLLRNATVLEVGFGTGAGTMLYAPVTEFVDAIEIDPGAVNFANAMYPYGNVNWRLGDIVAWEPKRQYDFCVMVETLEHIRDWEGALANIHRSLYPMGQLIMTSRNANADLRRWKGLHEREVTAQELHDMLSIFFAEIEFYDYSLSRRQHVDTRVTPIVALCRIL